MPGTEKTFAWIGSAIVNVSFISFITWGATSNWWIGFIVSVCYTILLFGLARVLDSEHSWLVFFSRFRSPNDVEDIDRFNESSQSGRPTMLVTLLYGLATLSLGVTGSFLSMNAIDCSTSPYEYDDTKQPDYKTDLSKLPDDVQRWARNPGKMGQGSSFTYLPGSKRTLFNEYLEGNIGKLWSVIPSKDGPKVLNEYGAYEFVLPNPSLACFITGKRSIKNDYYENRKVVACSDGSDMQFAKGTKSIPPEFRRNLFVSKSNILWYQDDPPSDKNSFKTTDRLIYSLDPETMAETLHSVPGTPTHEKHTAYEDCRKTKAIASLFLIALPTIISSCYLWYQRQVPSMGITTYIGMTTAAICIFYYSRIRLDPFDDYFFQRWLMWFGLVYTLACANGILSTYFDHKAPMQWGLHMAAVSFFIGSIFELDLYDIDVMPLIHWIIFNVASLVPLCGIGLATRSPFLLVLTAIGIIMDAFRLCEELTKNLGETPAAVTYFVILGLTGLGTALSGWFLSQQQDDLSNFGAAHLEPYVWPRRQAEFSVLPTQDDLYVEAPPTEDGHDNVQTTTTASYNLEARTQGEASD